MPARSNPPEKTDVERSRSRSSSFNRSYDQPTGVAERLLALRPWFRSLQQPEAIGESIPDLTRAHGGHARRGQLDRPAGARRGVGRSRHRGGGLRVVQARSRAARRGRARRTTSTASDGPPSSASGEPTAASRRPPAGLARRGEDLCTSDRPRIVRQPSGRVQHVLAVVDHEQQPLARDRFGDGVDQRDVALRRDTQRCRNGRCHGGRLADRISRSSSSAYASVAN